MTLCRRSTSSGPGFIQVNKPGFIQVQSQRNNPENRVSVRSLIYVIREEAGFISLSFLSPKTREKVQKILIIYVAPIYFLPSSVFYTIFKIKLYTI